MDELEEVDCAIEKGRFEFAFEVDVGASGRDAVAETGDVDECPDVDCELAEDGAYDVPIEDVWLGPLFRETFYRLIILLAVFINTWISKPTLAREMDKKQTLINIPLIVTCPSPNLIPSRYKTLRLYALIRQFNAKILYI